MAFQASDGFKSSNRAPMRQHEKSMMAKKSMAGGAGDPLQQPAGGAQEMGQEDGAQVAQEHGPAQEVHMMHNDEAGSHEVHSTHPDGHSHMSQHGSREEAHEHGKKLAGIGGEQEPDGDEPEYE